MNSLDWINPRSHPCRSLPYSIHRHQLHRQLPLKHIFLRLSGQIWLFIELWSHNLTLWRSIQAHCRLRSQYYGLLDVWKLVFLSIYHFRNPIHIKWLLNCKGDLGTWNLLARLLLDLFKLSMICVIHLIEFLLLGLGELKRNFFKAVLAGHFFPQSLDPCTFSSHLHASAEIWFNNWPNLRVLGLLGPNLLLEHIAALVVKSLIFVFIFLNYRVTIFDGLFQLVGNRCSFLKGLVHHLRDFVILRK